MTKGAEEASLSILAVAFMEGPRSRVRPPPLRDLDHEHNCYRHAHPNPLAPGAREHKAATSVVISTVFAQSFT